MMPTVITDDAAALRAAINQVMPMIKAGEVELDRLRAINAQLVEALRATLQSLEQHLDEATLAAGLKHREDLCPCQVQEVRDARAALKAAEGEA